MRRVQFDDDDVCGLSAQGSLPEAVARSKNLKEEISAETRSTEERAEVEAHWSFD